MNEPLTPAFEIKHTMCDICTPGPQCGVDAFVRDGKIVHMEGTKGFPGSDGRLCVKGAAGRQYLYRADRIRQPMKRVGERGSEDFAPISWDEALDTIAEKLLAQRAVDPDGTVFVSGYSKWYRPLLHRLAHSYGTENYITESSACHRAEVMSQKALYGCEMRCSPKDANTVVCWGMNAPVNAFLLGDAIVRRQEQGARIVVIDPRKTWAAEHADLWLRPKAGTDAALAHAVANLLLQNGWQDQRFLERYVHGFEEYSACVERFTPAVAESITGVPAADIERLAEWLALDPSGVVLPSNALTHRVNGFNTHRAVLSLMVLLGRVDRAGGMFPDNDSFCHSDGGFVSNELAFIDETRPQNAKKPVGAERFPLWRSMVDEGQGMELVRQITEGTPYPVKALALFGVNDRMYPESPKFLAAMDTLDFSFAVDIFWTDVCRHADIVLPACTSYERGELKCYAGHLVNYTQPAVAPLYESRSDADIICELSRRMKLGDARLDAGYEACVRYIFEPAGITDWEAVKAAPLPVEVPNAKRYEWGRYLAAIPTPSGKIELLSEAVRAHTDLNPLPAFEGEEPVADYPMTLISGARIPTGIHSRGHDVPWLKALRPKPLADINPADAEALGIADGDEVTVSSEAGSIRLTAHITDAAAAGEVHVYHGYRDANVNALIPMHRLDPYTGFPCYKQCPCMVKKA